MARSPSDMKNAFSVRLAPGDDAAVVASEMSAALTSILEMSLVRWGTVHIVITADVAGNLQRAHDPDLTATLMRLSVCGKRVGVTGAKLAALFDICPEHWSRLIHGHIAPSAALVRRIRSLLGGLDFSEPTVRSEIDAALDV